MNPKIISHILFILHITKIRLLKWFIYSATVPLRASAVIQ